MDGGRQKPQKDASFTGVFEPAVKFGAVWGGAGFLFGGTIGVIRGVSPLLFASASAVQIFALATCFSGTRSGLIRVLNAHEQPPTRRDLTAASAVAGGASGGIVGLLTRGRSHVIPGIIMFTVFGAVGQQIHSKLAASKPIEINNLWRNLADKSWSPIKVLKNEEYAKILEEKLLKLDVEISMLDDKIAALQEEQQKNQGEDTRVGIQT